MLKEKLKAETEKILLKRGKEGRYERKEGSYKKQKEEQNKKEMKTM